MELVQQLSREQGLQEFKELDLRLMRTSVSYLLEAMKVRPHAYLCVISAGGNECKTSKDEHMTNLLKRMQGAERHYRIYYADS
jgi:hypothetical protein